MTHILSVSTFLKNDALREFLDSYRMYGDRENLETLVICDDSDNKTAFEVYKEYSTVLPLAYTGGDKRVGIARNKNRGIKFFGETKSDVLILADDDILFTGEGIEDHFLECAKTREHVTTYLGNYHQVCPQENAFFDTFPPYREDENLYYCTGSQGMLLFQTRDIVDQVGYMDLLNFPYGFEHSLWSNRISRLTGYYMDDFPIMKRSPKYFKGNYSWPNQYIAEPEKNNAFWQKRKLEIFEGKNLRGTSSGL